MAVGSKERPPMLALAYGVNPGQASRVEEETYDNTTKEARALLDAESKLVHMVLNGIGNDIYSIVDAYPNSKEIWISIERLM
uniref:Uncharacterized protein n=1 Tax=Tanacetum cinerariifolium TaxID=118510 RepID=A0A699HWN1_TANCI|nr:hypothetical protein [Tanacetum cinerariifolium]